MLRSVRSSALLGMISVASLFMSAEVALGQDTGRVFLRFVGTDSDVEVLGDAAIRFQRPIHRAESVEFAGTAEMEEVYTECMATIGVPGYVEREFQLQAARRLFVDYILEIGVTSYGRDRFELSLEVWSPDSNGQVYADFIDVEAESVVEAARVGLPLLAESFLCFRGIDSHCATTTAPVTTTTTPSVSTGPSGGRLEIMDVYPSPVTVLIDGREVGVAPGQLLNLPLGQVEVTLRTTGYHDLTRRVTLTADELVELNGLRLEPLPATLIVSCNVDGATIEVDRATVGRTRGGGSVSLEVDAGRRAVPVSRDGYTAWETTLQLQPGASQSVQAELSVIAAPTPTPAATPPPTSSGSSE